MISYQRRNMVCSEYDYLPLTIAGSVTLSRKVHVAKRGRRKNHCESEQHKQVLRVKQTLYQVGFPPSGTGSLLFSLATPSFPHHIFMTSPAAQGDHYCHARMISRLHL